MKKEMIIYTGLILLTCALFSFEFSIKNGNYAMALNTFNAKSINSISFDTPANVYFIEGDESKIILEGSKGILNKLDLQQKDGNFELLSNFPARLMNKVSSLIWKNAPINVYVFSNNIKEISVSNQQGCLVNNLLFNEDRGTLQVSNADVVQFTHSNTTKYNTCSSLVYQKENDLTVINCL